MHAQTQTLKICPASGIPQENVRDLCTIVTESPRFLQRLNQFQRPNVITARSRIRTPIRQFKGGGTNTLRIIVMKMEFNLTHLKIRFDHKSSPNIYLKHFTF